MTKEEALHITEALDTAFFGFMNAKCRLSDAKEYYLVKKLDKEADELTEFIVKFVKKQDIVDEYMGFIKQLYGPEKFA